MVLRSLSNLILQTLPQCGAILGGPPEFIWAMIRIALLIITALLVCGGHRHALAQDRKLHFALTACGSVKYPFIGEGSRNYHLFGEAGVGVAGMLAGSTEESLSFLPKLSFVRENTGYHSVSSVKYVLETINLIFNPEILIPTRNEHLMFAAGIGVDWMMDMVLAEYGTNRNLAGTDLEAIYDTIYAARRPIIPFVSAGLLYRVHRGFHIEGFLRQDMRDAFPSGTIVTFNSNSAPLTVNLSHQPTRLGLGIMYVF
jgi:hypothetical protein